jgi:ribosomal protein S18 acetylase RimI-like enzyme
VEIHNAYCISYYGKFPLVDTVMPKERDLSEYEYQDASKEDIRHIVKLYSEHSNSSISINRLNQLIQDYPSVVVSRQDRIIGFAYCGRFAPDVLELMNIFVHKEFRYRGIGQKLILEIEKRVFHTYKGIILVNSLLYEVKDVKKLAKTFYKRNGYHLLMTTGSTNIYGKLERAHED